MRIRESVLGQLLACLTASALIGPVAAQEPEPAKKPVEFKGEAKTSAHRYKMEKGAIYRITAKGEGFLPYVQVDMPISPGGVGVPPLTSVNSINVRGKSDLGQMIFAPTETKEYSIKVDFAPGADIPKGPHPYTLTIERANFKPLAPRADAELNVSENSRKLEQGKVYHITVTGRGFEPTVQIVDAGKSKAMAFNNGKALGFGPDAEFVTSLTFVPTKTADYRILVAVGPYSPQRTGALAYTTKIAELKTDLVATAELSNKDPKYPRRGGPYKLHTVKLQADKKYQIDMMSSAFDSYLFLEDSAGKLLMEDDDGGDGLNARIIFVPKKTDTYRIIATTFNQFVGAPVGAYTLIVMENPDAVPRLRPFGSKSKGVPEIDLDPKN
jgi:hypothetical protein